MSLSPENLKVVETVIPDAAGYLSYAMSSETLNRLLDAARSSPDLGVEQKQEDSPSRAGLSPASRSHEQHSAGERRDLNREIEALVAEAHLRWKAHIDGVSVERLVRAMVGEAGDLTDMGLVRKLAARLDEAWGEVYDLRYAIRGGEDAPGYLMSLPHEQILELSREDRRNHGDYIDRVNRIGAALDEIAGSPLPDQPASAAGTEYEWALQHIARLRRIALDGLGCETGLYRPDVKKTMTLSLTEEEIAQLEQLAEDRKTTPPTMFRDFIAREWFGRKVAQEDGMEVGAGFSMFDPPAKNRVSSPSEASASAPATDEPPSTLPVPSEAPGGGGWLKVEEAISTAWYSGFVDAMGRAKWPDMYDWAALTGQDYAKVAVVGLAPPADEPLSGAVSRTPLTDELNARLSVHLEAWASKNGLSDDDVFEMAERLRRGEKRASSPLSGAGEEGR